MQHLRDPQQILTFVHSASPSMLADLLSRILGELPERLDSLRIFVPEVCALLGRHIVSRDLSRVAELSDALQAGLKGHMTDVEHSEFVGRALGESDCPLVAYLLGRLKGQIVLARQLPGLHISPSTRAEIMDRGDNQAILEQLVYGGAKPLTGLRQALLESPTAHLPKLDDVRKCLSRLVKLGTVEPQSTRSSGLLYLATDVGRELVLGYPPWLDDVRRVYQAYRASGSADGLPFGDALEAIFGTVDESFPGRR